MSSKNDSTPETAVRYERRALLGFAATVAAFAEHELAGNAQPNTVTNRAESRPAAASNSIRLKQIDAGVLSVECGGAGPANGPVVILLHGWLYDMHSFAEVAPMLAALVSASGYLIADPELGEEPLSPRQVGLRHSGSPQSLHQEGPDR